MWESEDLEAGARRKVVVLIAVVAAAALGFWLWYSYVAHHRPAAPPPPVSATPPPPARPTPGATAIATQGEITALSDANFERYAPLVKAVQGTDVKALALVYRRLYPLFQQSYEDLGYPGKYFNDRLVEVIDHLLQAPVVQAPIPLVQPGVMYEH